MTAQASPARHLGKRISVSNSPGRQSVAKYPRKSCRRNQTRARFALQQELAAEEQAHRRQLGRWICMNQTTANGSPIANLKYR